MGAGKGSRECSRILLWMIWVTVWLITGIYCALAVITFAKLWQAASELQYGASTLAQNKIWRSPLCALVLSALLVFGFNMMCCVTLVKKSVNRGGPGFGYGFMVAFSISLSVFLLLSGLVLDGFRPVVQENLEPVYDAVNGTLISGASSWSAYSSQSFVGTEVFALISFCTYLLFGIALVILQSAVGDQLGINEAAGYGSGAVPTLIPTTEFKDVPAAPPDYDQYAQYGQYGYAQDGQQQQYYDPNAMGGYGPQAPIDAGQGDGTPVGYSTQATGQGNGYYQQPPTYQHDLAHQNSYSHQAYAPSTPPAPPMYAHTGFAAVGGYNTTSTTEDHNATGLISGQTNSRNTQI